MSITKKQYKQIEANDQLRGINPLLKVQYTDGNMRSFFLHYLDFIFMWTDTIEFERREVESGVIYHVSPTTKITA